jgi:translation initiation factor 1
MATCPDCGMSEELCVCDDIAKSDKTIEVYVDSRSYNKEMTIVDGLGDDVDRQELASTLKTKLACGGTAKDGHIELQGNHTYRIKDVLVDEGFDRGSIDVN